MAAIRRHQTGSGEGESPRRDANTGKREMTESTRASRPRLSLGVRATTNDAATTPPRPTLRVVPPQPAPARDANRACGMDRILDPVRSHFDLSDDKADELAAFARMLLSDPRARTARI